MFMKRKTDKTFENLSNKGQTKENNKLQKLEDALRETGGDRGHTGHMGDRRDRGDSNS